MFVLAASVVAITPWWLTDDSPCDDVAGELHEIWNREVKDAIGRAVVSTGVEDAQESWNRIAPRIDDYARVWSVARVDACRATVDRREQSQRQFALRLGCLHRAADELAAVTNV